MTAFDTQSPHYDPAKLPGALGTVSLGNGTADTSSQQSTASGSAMKLGPGMFPEANTCVTMLYIGIHQCTFNVTNQTVRKFAAVNATQMCLATGVDVKRLLADKASNYTRPGLRWGEVLFLFWGEQRFPSGRRSHVSVTLSVRVPGSDGTPSRLLNFASIDPEWTDRDIAKNLLLQALQADIMPKMCAAVMHPLLGSALLASNAAQIDAHGRRYVVLRPKASIAHEPVFAYETPPGNASKSDPSPVPTKKAYTFKQYEADITSAMRRQWPVEVTYSDLMFVWGCRVVKDGFECFPKGDLVARQMMDLTASLL